LAYGGEPGIQIVLENKPQEKGNKLTAARKDFFVELLTNERGFHLLFCDLLQSESFTLYHNGSFSEDPIFNHFLISDALLQNPSPIDQSKVNAVVRNIRSKAAELKLATSLFIENFWERRGQFEKAALDVGYRITDKMEILAKRLTDQSNGSTSSIPLNDRTHGTVRLEISYTNDIESWTRVFMSAYSIPSHWRDELIRREHQILSTEKAKFILAKDSANNSAPNGCLLSFSSQPKCTGIYCVGTVPEYRGKGVAREMLSFVEKNALIEHQAFLTLQTLTSDGVSPLYKNIGYKTEFERCIYWSPLVS
jgi:GNAT superfamily N-acetyltransferase